MCSNCDNTGCTECEAKTENEKDMNDKLSLELYEVAIKYIEEERVYRDNTLRLSHLADQIGFSTHLLSKVVNSNYGSNFNQMINSYRLKEAESLLKNNELLNIKSIYFDVGFSNKVTFYKMFKKKHGITPKEYRESYFNSKIL